MHWIHVKINDVNNEEEKKKKKIKDFTEDEIFSYETCLTARSHSSDV